MKTNTGRRGVSVLLILAMLIVSVAALVPVAASAAPVGTNASDIQNFTFQTLSDANQDDEKTDLRFLFSISSLDYDEVGFVFSKTVSEPTYEGANCGTFKTTTVYSSVTANEKQIHAPDGRHWVAVKLSEIPLADFESTIYVRPFIRVGENYSYVDAMAITVCEALTIDKTVAGESAIYNSTSPAGHAYQSGNDFKISKTIAEIRGKDTANEKHFFPTEGDPTNKQLYIEYSFLWNETLANAVNARMSLGWFGGKWGDREMFGLYVKDDNDRSAGSFDLCSGLQNLWGHNTGLVEGPKDVANYPTLSNQYGWHRIGIVFDNSVLSTPSLNNTDRANADAHLVEYYGFIDLYIDGVMVWHCRANIQGNWNKDQKKWLNNDGFRAMRALTFLAYGGQKTDGEFTGASEYDGVSYVDLDTVTVNMTIDDVANSTNAVYIAVSDVQYTCGKGFVRQVSPASLYPDRVITLGETNCSGKIWYVFDNPDN